MPSRSSHLDHAANRTRVTTRESGSPYGFRRRRDGHVDLPFTGYTLECVGPGELECEFRAGDRIHHGPRREDLPGTGEPGDACADVYRDAPEVITSHLALSGVNTRSDLEAEFTDTFTDEREMRNGLLEPDFGNTPRSRHRSV